VLQKGPFGGCFCVLGGLLMLSAAKRLHSHRDGKLGTTTTLSSGDNSLMLLSE
jgi:hypothetical protein